MESPQSLEDLCVLEVHTQLLLSCDDEYGYRLFIESLSRCPPRLIEYLVTRTAALQHLNSIDYYDLETLINTQKITYFELYNTHVYLSGFSRLFKKLAQHGEQMEGLTWTLYPQLEEIPHPLNSVIHLCSMPNLRVLRTDMYIPSWVLRKLRKLEILEAPRLCDFPIPTRGRALTAMGHTPLSQCTLREELLLFLMNSSNLKVLTCPYVMEPFERLLEAHSVHSNSIPTFQLREIHFRRYLENTVAFRVDAAHQHRMKLSDHASSDILRIINKSCPHLSKLRIPINTGDSLEGLSVFKNLHTLSIVVDRSSDETVDLDEASLVVLSQLRSSLISLTIENFQNVDFVRIGATFPYLRNLCVRGYKQELGVNWWPINSYFSSLEKMCLSSWDFTYTPGQGLLEALLRNCHMLQELEIRDAGCIDDRFLDVILRLNKLEYLEDVHFHDCRVSEVGARKLKSSCKRLKPLTFRSQELSNVVHVCLTTDVDIDIGNDDTVLVFEDDSEDRTLY